MNDPLIAKKEFLDLILKNYFKPNLVNINKNNIKNLNLYLNANFANTQPLPSFAYNPKDSIQFALVFNSINHQYWDIIDNKFTRFTYNNHIGAEACIEALRELCDLSENFEELHLILSKNPQLFLDKFKSISNPQKRLQTILQTIGKAGAFTADMIFQCALEDEVLGIDQAYSISRLLPLGYTDPFLKKSQLALNMSASYLKSFGINSKAITTCFADYQIPKVLRSLNILEFNPILAKLIDEGILIEDNSIEENAIRSATILAVELIANKFKMDPAIIDFNLWTLRNQTSLNFHLTKTDKY